jgi:hypothetical protein
MRPGPSRLLRLCRLRLDDTVGIRIRLRARGCWRPSRHRTGPRLPVPRHRPPAAGTRPWLRCRRPPRPRAAGRRGSAGYAGWHGAGGRLRLAARRRPRERQNPAFLAHALRPPRQARWCRPRRTVDHTDPALTAKTQDCYRSVEQCPKCFSHIYLCNISPPSAEGVACAVSVIRHAGSSSGTLAPHPARWLLIRRAASLIRRAASLIRRAAPSSWAGTGTGADREAGVPGDRGADRVVLGRQHPGAGERPLREAPGQRRVPEHGRYR